MGKHYRHKLGGKAGGKAGSSVILEADYLYRAGGYRAVGQAGGYRAGGQAGGKAGGHELGAKLEAKLGLP